MKVWLALFVSLSSLNLFAALEVVRVLPNKINYKLNEDAVISVTVANRGEEKEDAELMVLDKWNLDQQKVISKIPVSLDGNTEKTFEIPWNTGKNRYGHETRAVLMKDSKELSAKSEFFNVINEWWRVNIGVWPNVIGGTAQGDRLCKWYGYKPFNTRFDRFFYKSWGNSPIGPFATYFTCWTPWNMSFSTYGVYYDPSIKDDEHWWAVAEGSEQRTYNDFKEEAAFAKKWGVHRTKYLAPNVTGNQGFELIRKHPHWFLKDIKGDMAYNGALDPLTLTGTVQNQPYFADWAHVKLNFAVPEAVKHGVDSAMDSIHRFEFNGIYFDGIYRLMSGYDHEGSDLYKKYDKDIIDKQISDYFVQRFNEFRKTHPDFYHWANGWPRLNSTFQGTTLWATPASGALWETGEMPMNPNIGYLNVWSSFKELGIRIRNGIWEIHRTQPNKFNTQTNILHIGYTAFPDGLWMFGPSGGAWARKGIKFENFEKSKQFWCINSHMAAIMAALCSHPYAQEGAGYRPFNQVMTRYSDFYWHEDIYLLKKAFKKFTVDALRDIWWDDFVYTRETPEYTDYYIHLLNAPDVKNLSYETIKETLPAKNVEISSRLFKDIKRVQAWAIQPYGSTGDVLEPVVSKLTPEQIDDEIVFSPPDFRYYTLLVIREKK